MIKSDYVYNTFALVMKAIGRRNGRVLRRKERKLERKIKKELNGQRDYILKKVKKLFANKTYRIKSDDEDINKILDDIPDEQMTDIIIGDSKDVMEFGANKSIKQGNLGKFGIAFTLDHPRALEYLESERPLVLAKMADTVKDEIKPILQDALKSGQSYNDTAEIISNAFGFSKSRAQMISVNEIGHAYNAGQSIPYWDAHEKGIKVRKRWITVGDDRVTEECADNEAEGWIPFEDYFLSNDFDAPRDSHPRCRCDVIRETID